MEMVKKNIISIVCGVVAIIAIVAAFIPLGGYAQELNTALAGRVSVLNTLSGLLKEQRQLPVVKLDESSTPEPLKVFPSESIIKQGQAVTEAVQKESIAVRDAAIAMNAHKLLVPGSLPNPTAPDQFRFRDEYRRIFTPSAKGLVQLSAAMNAGMPPSIEEVTLKQTELAEKIKKDTLWYLTNGQPGNLDQVNAQVKDETAKLPEEMRSAVAKQSKVYVNLDTFEVNQRIAGANAPDPIDIFIAQFGLWIQQDVAAAVIATNKDAKNLIEAPVKHLVRVHVPPTFVLAPETPPGADPDAVLPKSPAHSMTGRICNALYDVVHFDVVARVDAAEVPRFLKELGHNRLITPLKVDVKVIDSALQLANGYYYGEKPIVEATIQCEALFLRKWTEPIVPQKIKEKLGMTPPQQTAGLQ